MTAGQKTPTKKGASPAPSAAPGTAPDPSGPGHGYAGPGAQPQVSPSRSHSGEDGGPGASDAPAGPPVAPVTGQVAVDQVDEPVAVAPPPAPPVVIDHDGVYDGLPEEQYHGHRDSLSSSGARQLLPPSCPALFQYERENGRPPKRTFDYGHAAHQRVLGVGAELVVVQKVTKDKTRVDAGDYNTKSAQEHRDEIREMGAVPLLRKELDQVDAMAAAILEHPLASVLFDPDRGGKPEQSLFWTDPACGVLRRARLDWLPAQLTAAGRLVIPDYKTTTSASKQSIAKSVREYGYHQQDDWYRDLVVGLDLAEDVAFLFVFQEKTPPFLITVAEVDAPSKRVAHELNLRALDVYADCVATDEWPGYSDEIELVGLPPHILREFGELL